MKKNVTVKVKKAPELFTISMLKDLEKIFRNCSEDVAKKAFQKLVDYSIKKD